MRVGTTHCLAMAVSLSACVASQDGGNAFDESPEAADRAVLDGETEERVSRALELGAVAMDAARSASATSGRDSVSLDGDGRSFDSGVSPEEETARLVDDSRSLAEGLMLARLAYGYLREPAPTTPPNFEEPDAWAFEGYVGRYRFPSLVAEALERQEQAAEQAAHSELREAIDQPQQKDEDRRTVEAMRALAAEQLGRNIDTRRDLYVAIYANGQIWRRKFTDHMLDHEALPDALEPSERAPGEEGMPLTDGAAEADDSRSAPRSFQHANGDDGVIGSDSRGIHSQWNGQSMTGSVWQPQGAIVGSSYSGGFPEAACSGTKVEDRMVVTNAHCIWKASTGTNTYTKWVPGADGIAELMNGDDSSPNGYKIATTRLVYPDFYDGSSIEDDFGIFVLRNNTNSCNLHHHGLMRPYGDMQGWTVYGYGYPAYWHICKASPLNNDHCESSLYGMAVVVNDDIHHDELIKYKFDSQGGMSGAGIYTINNGSRYVRAVNRGCHSSSYNEAVKVTVDKFYFAFYALFDYPATACD